MLSALKAEPRATQADKAAEPGPIREAMEYGPYRDAVAKLTNLHTELAEKRGRLDEIRRQQQGASRSLDDQARSLLEGGSLGTVVIATGEYGELLRHERLLERAIVLQKERVLMEWMAAGRAVAIAVRPEYSQVIHRLAAALVEVGRIADEERKLRQSVDQQSPFSGAGSLDPLPFEDLCLGIEGSRVNYWLDQAATLHAVKVKAARESGTVGIRGPQMPAGVAE